MFDLNQYDSSIALVEDGNSITYGKLAGIVDSIPAHKYERSLAFILCSNSLGSIAGYIAFVNNGVVPLLLDDKIDDSLLENLIKTYRPSLLWVPNKSVERFRSREVLAEVQGYALLATHENDPCKLHPDLTLLMSTSGSTGSPKLVRLTKKNLKSNTESIIEYLGITSSERSITSLPMNYVYGLSIINTHLYAGASIVLTESSCYSKAFWRLVADEQVTSFAGVPFTYDMLAKLRITKRPPSPSLRYFTQAGGKLRPDLQELFATWAHKSDVDYVVMYGASEATARMGYLPSAQSLQKLGSMGIAIPGGRFELVNEQGLKIDASGVVGELVYYGPNVSMGYATCADDLALGDKNQGRLLTGDMAQRDEDGYYYIVGRRKRFVKIVGKRVNLDEVERLVAQRFSDAQVACAGRDDLLAVFVTDDGITEDVLEHIHALTDVNRLMIKVVFVPEIPKNASGKTQYANLLTMLEDHTS